MTNIMDGMDQARFKSVNSAARKQNKKEDKSKTPPVIKNLKNGS